ncbi:SUR7/PalI family-domain-containing protein [Naematelia encephala]|uniref:SUR7/PalI family-domain-containing protein n=1 Tax=Naematelia encephala TaxID=71784 RepID=A0A1Y2B5Q7_9TREE|nr:SUR7/PalI family-domain-containing protein [Naematelia encephala]
MLARAAFPSFFFTLGAFILLLLVTLSAPVIKSIELLHVEDSNGATVANFGVLGVCYPGGVAKILGITISDDALCPPAHVGYEINSTLFGQNTNSHVETIATKSLTGSLILNTIAAGVAGVSLFFAFFAWFCSSRFMEIFTFLTLLVSSVVAWVAFWLDIGLALVARHMIGDVTNKAFTGHLGNGIWMALAGALSLSFAICLAGCGSFGRYSERYASREIVPGNEKGYRRGWLGRGTPAYRGTY